MDNCVGFEGKWKISIFLFLLHTSVSALKFDPVRGRGPTKIPKDPNKTQLVGNEREKFLTGLLDIQTAAERLSPFGGETDALLTARVKLVVFLVEVGLHTLLLKVMKLLLVFLREEQL